MYRLPHFHASFLYHTWHPQEDKQRSTNLVSDRERAESNVRFVTDEFAHHSVPFTVHQPTESRVCQSETLKESLKRRRWALDTIFTFISINQGIDQSLGQGIHEKKKNSIIIISINQWTSKNLFIIINLEYRVCRAPCPENLMPQLYTVVPRKSGSQVTNKCHLLLADFCYCQYRKLKVMTWRDQGLAFVIGGFPLLLDPV